MGLFDFTCDTCDGGGQEWCGSTVKVECGTRGGDMRVFSGVYDGYGGIDVIDVSGKEATVHLVEFTQHLRGAWALGDRAWCERCSVAAPRADGTIDAEMITVQDLRCLPAALVAASLHVMHDRAAVRRNPTARQLIVGTTAAPATASASSASRKRPRVVQVDADAYAALEAQAAEASALKRRVVDLMDEAAAMRKRHKALRASMRELVDDE